MLIHCILIRWILILPPVLGAKNLWLSRAEHWKWPWLISFAPQGFLSPSGISYYPVTAPADRASIQPLMSGRRGVRNKCAVQLEAKFTTLFLRFSLTSCESLMPSSCSFPGLCVCAVLKLELLPNINTIRALWTKPNENFNYSKHNNAWQSGGLGDLYWWGYNKLCLDGEQQSVSDDCRVVHAKRDKLY